MANPCTKFEVSSFSCCGGISQGVKFWIFFIGRLGLANTNLQTKFGVHRGHSRSSTMSPFDRAHTTSYSTLIEAMHLSCNVFCRAMLCIRGTSHGPVSVCLSITSRCSTKTAKRKITQTTPHDSPGTLVFWHQRSPSNSTGVTPYGGTKCRWGGSKSATFNK